MTKKDAVRLFEDRQVRSVWDSDAEKWYVSVIDVIEVLTDSANPRRYWSDLKRKLNAEGSQLYENIVQLKMKSADGKSYNTDVADVEQLFRLIQSIPSPKAEPFKQWLAQLGRERLEEIDDPEQGIERLMEYYHRKGYSANWINQRLKSIEVRKELTDEWERRGIQKGQQYAILTDVITQSWSGLTTKQYLQKPPQLRSPKMKNPKLLHTANRLHNEAVGLPVLPVKNWRHKPAKRSLAR